MMKTIVDTPAMAVIRRLEDTPGQLTDHWCVPPQTGRFLATMALATKARRVCEIGTSIGYSTLWFAYAMSQTNGVVDTLEYFEARQAQAISHVAEAGLSERVRFHLGPALETLARFAQEGRVFDMVFLDAAKQEYLPYVQCLEAMMPPGAVLIADNTHSHRDSMSDFLTYMAEHSGFLVAELETPNGQLVAYKL
jgi:predicted O-methyltransferase YrrM